MWGGWDTQTLLDDLKIELYALTGGGYAKTFCFPYLPSASTSAPHEPSGETFST